MRIPCLTGEKTIASHSKVSRISLQGALRENKKIHVGYNVFKIKSLTMSVVTGPKTYRFTLVMCFASRVIHALRVADSPTE